MSERIFFGVCFIFFGQLDVIVSAEVEVKTDLQSVEDFRNVAEVGNESCKHQTYDGLGDDDLCERVGVNERQHCVSALFDFGFAVGVCGSCSNCGTCALITGALTEFCGFEDKVEEVGNVRIVVDDVKHVLTVKVQRTAVEIDTADYDFVAVFVVFNVTLFVEFDEFECEFDGIEVAFCKERVKIGLAAEQRGDVEFCKVGRHGKTETYAVVERAVGLEFENEVFNPGAEQRTEVVGFGRSGIEVQDTAEAERDSLTRELRNVVVFKAFRTRNRANAVNVLRYVNVAFFVGSGNNFFVRRCNVNLNAGFGFEFEFETGVGLSSDAKCYTAVFEIKIKFASFGEFEAVKVDFRTRDKSEERGKHIAVEQNRNAETAFKHVVGIFSLNDHTRSENEFSDESVDYARNRSDIHAFFRRLIGSFVRRGGVAARCGGRVKRAYSVKQVNEVEFDSGTAERVEVEIEVAFGKIHRDVGSSGRFGIEDNLNADLQRVFKYVSEIDLGCCKVAAEDFVDAERFEVERTEDFDLEVIVNRIVEGKVKTERCDERIDKSLQITCIESAECFLDCRHLEDYVNDIRKVHGLAHIETLGVLNITAVADRDITFAGRITRRFFFRKLDISRACGVRHGNVKVETNHGAARVAVEFFALNRVYSVGYVGACVKSEFGAVDCKTERRKTYIGFEADGRFGEVHVEVGFGVELFDDVSDFVSLIACHRFDKSFEQFLSNDKADMVFAEVKQNVEGFLRAVVVCRAYGFSRTARFAACGNTREEFCEFFGDNLCKRGVFEREGVFKQHAFYPNLRTSEIYAQYLFAVCGVLVREFEHDFRSGSVLEVDVRTDVEIYANYKVGGNFKTERKFEVCNDCGQQIADCKFAVLKRRGIFERDFEVDVGLNGQHFEVVVNALIIFGSETVGSDHVTFAERDSESAEGKRNREGIYSEGHFNAKGFVFTAEVQREEAVFGVELHEVVGVDVVNGVARFVGKEGIENERQELCAEVNLRRRIIYINTIYSITDNILYNIENAAVVCRRFFGTVGGGNGFVAALFGAAAEACEQRVEVEVGNCKFDAVDDAAFVGADVKRACAVFTREQVNGQNCRAHAFGVGCEHFKRDVGMRQQIVDVRKVCGVETHIRRQTEVNGGCNVSVDTEFENNLRKQILDAGVDCGVLRNVGVFEECFNPLTDSPTVFGVRKCLEVD